MKNQFFYLRKEPNAITVEGQELTFTEFIDSFNLDKVIRTVAIEDGRRLVLLDDLHTRLQEVPVTNKQGKITAYKKENNTFQSEIYLEPLDNERFINLYGE